MKRMNPERPSMPTLEEAEYILVKLGMNATRAKRFKQKFKYPAFPSP
jgi:hypothetical protein